MREQTTGSDQQVGNVAKATEPEGQEHHREEEAPEITADDIWYDHHGNDLISMQKWTFLD